MKGFVLVLLVVGSLAQPLLETKRSRAGTGWYGKIAKLLPGPLARRLAFNAATGYGTGKCLTSMQACPAQTASVCTAWGGLSATTLCSEADPDLPVAADKTLRGQLYAWAATKAATQAADTVFAIPTGQSWNAWAGLTCGSVSCTDVYTKAILLYDEANCWPKTMAVPIVVNSRGALNDGQLKGCANTVRHLIGKKPLGAFLRSPMEALDRVLLDQVLFTCGNHGTGANVVQYPGLEGEGGGGTASNPRTYAEQNGMCGSWNTANLKADYKTGGTRFGGSVVTEEFGHTIFDLAISEYDPQGWLAVQKAEAQAAARYTGNTGTGATGHMRSEDWDCHTAATEYFAAGVDMLLYGVRIGENLKATTRTELKTQEPMLWCLALRHYELNNKYNPCIAAGGTGPAMEDVIQDVDCKALLCTLGVTTFGPEGTGGAKGGGAKTVSTDITSSAAVCPSQTVQPVTTCAPYASPGITCPAGTPAATPAATPAPPGTPAATPAATPAPPGTPAATPAATPAPTTDTDASGSVTKNIRAPVTILLMFILSMQ